MVYCRLLFVPSAKLLRDAICEKRKLLDQQTDIATSCQVVPCLLCCRDNFQSTDVMMTVTLCYVAEWCTRQRSANASYYLPLMLLKKQIFRLGLTPTAEQCILMFWSYHSCVDSFLSVDRMCDSQDQCAAIMLCHITQLFFRKDEHDYLQYRLCLPNDSNASLGSWHRKCQMGMTDKQTFCAR